MPQHLLHGEEIECARCVKTKRIKVKTFSQGLRVCRGQLVLLENMAVCQPLLSIVRVVIVTTVNTRAPPITKAHLVNFGQSVVLVLSQRHHQQMK